MSAAGWPDLGMRVSDADRSEIADRLARHFGDGRLDQAEFDQRLDQCLRAKTRADLIGLLADLPGDRPAPPAIQSPNSGRLRRQQRQLLRVQLERERLILRHERRQQRRIERAHHWYSMSRLPVLLLIILAVVIVARLVRDIYSIWLVLAVLAFLWFRHADQRKG
jgi:hypothetical protein